MLVQLLVPALFHGTHADQLIVRVEPYPGSIESYRLARESESLLAQIGKRALASELCMAHFASCHHHMDASSLSRGQEGAGDPSLFIDGNSFPPSIFSCL